ncbi:hypothetical protein [Kitasatospora sp. NPDC085879]|uniref:hypothetical protein n=1 Tax=Kitasatospora sp. NPDC085879 TaxID=3154769 RepID=UPI00341BC88E
MHEAFLPVADGAAEPGEGGGDPDGARQLLTRLYAVHPGNAVVWADSAYVGELVARVRRELGITIEVVERPPDAQGFIVLPRRWVVERSAGRCPQPAPPH